MAIGDRGLSLRRSYLSRGGMKAAMERHIDALSPSFWSIKSFNTSPAEGIVIDTVHHGQCVIIRPAAHPAYLRSMIRPGNVQSIVAQLFEHVQWHVGGSQN